MRLLYLTFAVFALGASDARAQQPDTRGYTVFLRGTPIGREDITVRSEQGALVISGTGRLSPPLDIVTRRAEVRYTADWSPISMVLEGTVQLRENKVNIAFTGEEARVESSLNGQNAAKVDKVSPQTLVLPNGFFGFFEAVARRRGSNTSGSATSTPPRRRERRRYSVVGS